MILLSVEHTTTYRYANPVVFGDHRLMFRPRDSHDLRLVNTQLIISPAANVRWYHDVFGNSIAVAQFPDPARELKFVSLIELEHYCLDTSHFVIEPYAQLYPFSYAADEIPDLGRTTERHYPDPDHVVDQWARRFFSGVALTEDLLFNMTKAIQREFTYIARDSVGTQTPIETLSLSTGSCRDFALLMIEAARSLGFAARFVSGYLYDSALAASGATNMVGCGATHAWVQIYLPGAGWVEFDPTNGIIGGSNLIRVAVAREPVQAVPLIGSYTGYASDFLGLEVDVRVTRLNAPSLAAAS